MLNTEIAAGTKLCRYSVRDGVYHIQEGTVNLCGGRSRVNFVDGGPSVACPRSGDIGVVKVYGPTLWLAKRDDELAKRLFTNFMEKTIADLEAVVKDKKRVLEVIIGA